MALEVLIEDVCIVNSSLGDPDKRGDIAVQVYQCVQFDRAFTFSEPCPWGKRGAQIDGSGFESIDGLVQFRAELVD